MFTFKSPVIEGNVWKLCFRPKEEMTKIYYEDRTPEEGCRIYGITDYTDMTVYIDDALDGFVLIKTLRHELMHVYLWETGQQCRQYSEEEVCDLMSVASHKIIKLSDDIMTRLKEGWYKSGQ